MQCAIDNAKRKYAIDLTKEIRYLKNSLNIEENGLPLFWQITKKDKRKARSDEERHERDKKNRKRIVAKINKELVCPMNYIFNVNTDNMNYETGVKPISEYFSKVEMKGNRQKSRKVEEFIERYSIELHKTRFDDDSDDNYFLLRNDFDKIVSDIRAMYISKNYLGLMSWLINRAFLIGAGAKSKSESMNSVIKKNKPLLLKVLYEVNKDAFLQCFKGISYND